MSDTNRLFSEQIAELKRLAHHVRRHLSSGQTLNTTALVHEAWMKLVEKDGTSKTWDSPGHFFAAASCAMRNRLIDHLRSKDTLRRGGNLQRVEIENLDLLAEETSPEVALGVLECIAKLAEQEGQQLTAEVFNLHYVMGFEREIVQSSLELDAQAVLRHLKFGKAIVLRCLKGKPGVSISAFLCG